MITLSSVIALFEADFIKQYGGNLLPGQRKALGALKRCRTAGSTLMKLCCSACDEVLFTPHSLVDTAIVHTVRIMSRGSGSSGNVRSGWMLTIS